MSENQIATPLATKDLEKRIMKTIEGLNAQGFIKKGAGECVKNINRKKTEIIILAADTEPIEIIANLPELCKVKDVPYIFISSKENLGLACGMKVGCIAVSIVPTGDSARAKIQKEISYIIEERREL